jgi:hypothetical protein
MFEIIAQLATHVGPFLGVMGQVVTIWGFLNFINQLSLQNLTAVADRALSRLPGLKSAIFDLQICDEKDIAVCLDAINEITKRLYMDIKQLNIAKNYDMKRRIAFLSDKLGNVQDLKNNYLTYELGANWKHDTITSSQMTVAYIVRLEDQLLNIFDLSHASNTFSTHLVTNVIYVSWISLMIYLVECQYIDFAGYLFVVGGIFFWFARTKNE